MTDAVSLPRPSWIASPRLLWGAVAVLGVVTLALGAALVQVKTQTKEVLAAHTLLAVPDSGVAVPAMAPPASAAATAVDRPATTVSARKQTQAPVKPARIAIKKGATPLATSTPAAPAEVTGPSAAWPAHPAAPKVVCLSCGTVEAVTPFQREVAPSGAGAVAGAVLGGLVGNQVGGGDGKTLATVIGALGGGWAGNTVEKRMKKETIYQVELRMDDGSQRTLEQTSPLAVGSRVTVDGGVISPAGAAPVPVPM